jgi:aminopeptidase N
MDFSKEYFNSPYYFYIKEGKNDIYVYFNVSNTLTEARKKDEVVKFDKKHKKEIEKELSKIQKDKKLKTTKDVKDKLSKKKNELEELVDYDGTFLSSKIPIFNPYLSPKGTTDQEVVMNRQTNNPVTRGYRVYWGESTENEEDIISEIDFSDAFGYEETEDKDYKDTVKTLKDMGVENASERAKEFGKIPKVKKRQGKLKQRLSEKEQIEEAKKEKMKKMVEDIVLNKKSSNKDINKKNTNKGLSKILSKNIENIKKLADKEGIKVSDLIKILKGSE